MHLKLTLKNKIEKSQKFIKFSRLIVRVKQLRVLKSTSAGKLFQTFMTGSQKKKQI